MRRSCTWHGMVFHTEPGASCVMPTTSWQVLAPSGWMNWKIERSLEVAWLPRSRRLASPMRISLRRMGLMRRRAEQIEFRRRGRVGRGERHRFGAHADIEHVAAAERVASRRRPRRVPAPPILTAISSRRSRKFFVPVGLIASSASGASDRHRAADDHAVVMRVGQADAAGLEQVADVEIVAQLVGAHGGGGGGIDGEAGRVVGAWLWHVMMLLLDAAVRPSWSLPMPARYSACWPLSRAAVALLAGRQMRAHRRRARRPRRRPRSPSGSTRCSRCSPR